MYPMANTNILSWQSAFWAIVPIALNTMSLPSGKTLGFSSTYSFALKSSPIICAASALDSMARLIVYTWNTGSLPAALERWVSVRFGDTAESEDGSFESLRRNKYFTLCLSALGTLPQAVKIFAARGIPWTQVCCATYLASFCVDGIITLLARRRSPRVASGGDACTGAFLYRAYTWITLSISALYIYEILSQGVREQILWISHRADWVFTDMGYHCRLDPTMLMFLHKSTAYPCKVHWITHEYRFSLMQYILYSSL